MEGPVDALPQPEQQLGEKTLEEKILEYVDLQKNKKKRKLSKPAPPAQPTEFKRNIEVFYPREKGAGQLFVLVGKSERGKTHFLKWLLYSLCARKKDPFQYGLIMVRTKFKNSFSFHFASEQHVKIYEGFRLDILQAYIENLKRRFLEQKYLEPSFLVFDDLVGIIDSSDRWMQNFFGTYRHYNITIFIAVQYLTGRNSISPIMREQTSHCIIFNSKVQRTLQNLWENYGQLFPKKEFYAHLAQATDERHVGTRHAACVYHEHIDRLEDNYKSWLAPAELPDGQVILRGPDKPKPPSRAEVQKQERLKQLAYRAPSWLPTSLNGMSSQEREVLQRMLFYGDRARHRLKKDGKTMAQRDKEVLQRLDEQVQAAEKLASQRFRELSRPTPLPFKSGLAYGDAGTRLASLPRPAAGGDDDGPPDLPLVPG